MIIEHTEKREKEREALLIQVLVTTSSESR